LRVAVPGERSLLFDKSVSNVLSSCALLNGEASEVELALAQVPASSPFRFAPRASVTGAFSDLILLAAPGPSTPVVLCLRPMEAGVAKLGAVPTWHSGSNPAASHRRLPRGMLLLFVDFPTFTAGVGEPSKPAGADRSPLLLGLHFGAWD
jgi:hypothetical protein